MIWSVASLMVKTFNHQSLQVVATDGVDLV